MNARPSEAALSMLDAVASRLISRAKPVRFGVAQSPAEKEAVYRLRYQVVIERGWARPEDYPDELETDSYDESAINVVGLDGDVLAATTRLVLPEPDRPLPTEEAFGLVIEPPGGLMDMNRIIVARGYSDPRSEHAILLGLMGYAWLQVKAHGFTDVCGSFTAAVIRLYEHFGIRIVTVGPSRLYWGEERFPIRTDMIGSASALNRRFGKVTNE